MRLARSGRRQANVSDSMPGCVLPGAAAVEQQYQGLQQEARCCASIACVRLTLLIATNYQMDTWLHNLPCGGALVLFWQCHGALLHSALLAGHCKQTSRHSAVRKTFQQTACQNRWLGSISHRLCGDRCICVCPAGSMSCVR